MGKKSSPSRSPRARRTPLIIDTDPAIGCALKVDGMNIEDFIDRKRAEIEGLMAGAGALIELDRVTTGWNELCGVTGAARYPEGFEPIRTGESHKVAREMLQTALMVLRELYVVAQAAASRYRLRSRVSGNSSEPRIRSSGRKPL